MTDYILRERPDDVWKFRRPNCISLFTGAMGLDLGLSRSGFTTILACESMESARTTIGMNRPELPVHQDVFCLDGYARHVLKSWGILPDGAEIDLLAGGPPCQSWSSSGKRKGFADQRGVALLSFINVAEELRPRAVLMENVPGLLTAEVDGEKGGAMKLVYARFAAMGYWCKHKVLNAADFGVPQDRKRVIFLAGRDGMFLEHPVPSGQPPKTLRQALEGLPTDPRTCLPFSDKVLAYMKLVPEGGDWRDLPAEMQAGAMGGAFESEGGKTTFYRRLAWDKPAPTLTCHPVAKQATMCHPDEDRPLSVEEYMRVQQFPDGWKLAGSVHEKYTQVGNAVPVGLAEAVGKKLFDALSGKMSEPTPGLFS